MTAVFQKVRRLIFIVLCATIALPASAQQPLRLPEALQMVRKNNLVLLQQMESRKTATLNTGIQKTLRLPTIDVSFATTYLSEVNTIDISRALGNLPVNIPASGRVTLGGHDRSELILSARQPLFTGFRIRSSIDLAKFAELSETAKYEVLNNQVIHKVVLLYYQAQSLHDQEKILRQSLKRLHVQLENVRNLFEASQVMAFDTLQVYNQTLTLQIELENNAVQRDLLELQLARILNLERPRPLELVSPKPPGKVAGALEDLKRQARRNRPELRQVQLALQSTGVQGRLLKSSYWPAVFAQASYHFAKPGLDPVADEWMDYFSAGVSLQWNLWRWGGDRKKVQQVHVQENRLNLQQRELLQTIDYEVSDGYEHLMLSLRQIGLARQLQDQQAERYRIVSVQHQNGLASTNDLVTAETDLTRSQLQYQLAVVNYYIAEANLRLAVGTISQSIQ